MYFNVLSEPGKHEAQDPAIAMFTRRIHMVKANKMEIESLFKVIPHFSLHLFID